MALMHSCTHKDHYTKKEAKKKDLLKTFVLSKMQRQKLNLWFSTGYVQAAYHVHFANAPSFREL